MADIVTIAGSPSYPSRSSAFLEIVRRRFEERLFVTESIQLRDLSAEALLWAQADHPEVQAAIQAVNEARVIIIATPVYKAAYTGLLKVFLDLLPQYALLEKTILPIATGGSSAHLLAIDYALKPVLSALGAQHILNGLYIQDSQFQYVGDVQLDPAITARLDKLIDSLTTRLVQTESWL
jgi:FMN reductase